MLLLALSQMLVLAGPAACVPQGEPDSPSGVADSPMAELVAAAEQLWTEQPEEWARLGDVVAGLLEAHRKQTEGWQYHRPPPPPDLGAAGLPAPYLMDRFLAVRGDRSSATLARALASALVKSDDPRGLAALVEAHDASESEPYGLVRLIAAEAPAERIPDLVRAQVRRKPPVEDGALALELLERVRTSSRRGAMDLPAEVGAAARTWLASFGAGPSNGLGDQVWCARLRLGGPDDRKALIPFLLGEENLLYALRAVLDAPLPHGELAAALRTRRDRMTAHERSYLTHMVQQALLVTDPEAELDGYVARLDGLLETAVPGDVTDEAMGRFLVDALVLVDVDHPRARAARARLLRDGRIPWYGRAHLVTGAWSAGRPDAAELRDWFLGHAPPREADRLRSELARISASSATR